MSIPGFSAVHSLDIPSAHYATVFGLDARVTHLQPALPRDGIRNGGGNGGGNGGCHITCTTCDSNCRRTCTNSCTGRSVTSSCCSGGFSCQNGTCVCPSPKTACGGFCTDTSSDSNNCGQCGKMCPSGTTCQQGDCYPKPMNCGACTSGPTSTQTCCQLVSPDQNQCGIAPCPAGCGSQPFPWCGQSAPTVISCPCPTGFECGPKCQGELCSVDWFCQPPPPTCQTTTGSCTGAGGADQCVTAGGTTKCCHSNWFYGWQPWVRVCSDGTVTSGCNGPCW
jgi:hypothetical protein